MTTLNCKEEIDLAQLLIKLHPWADQVNLLEVVVKQML